MYYICVIQTFINFNIMRHLNLDLVIKVVTLVPIFILALSLVWAIITGQVNTANL